ncbi:MAG TPA: hypothetical protein VF494_02820 [Candidatus Limnocylindrales bacterium]
MDHSILAAAKGRRRRSLRPLVLSVAVLASLVAACSSATTTPTSVPPAQTLAPGETPKPTAWPGSVVSATIALGAADPSFAKLAADLQTTVDTANMQGLLQVTTDGLTFLKGAQKNIPKLQAYAETKSLGDALANAYQQMIDGLQQIHDSLTSGNAAGVTAGFQQFAAGNETYGAVRAELSDKAQQALFMQKNYLR